MTHRAPLAFAACAAMARATWVALRGESPDAIAAVMVEAAQRYDAGTAQMIEDAQLAASREEPESVLQRLQGWAAHEAMAAAAYVFARHPDDGAPRCSKLSIRPETATVSARWWERSLARASGLRLCPGAGKAQRQPAISAGAARLGAVSGSEIKSSNGR